MEKHYGPLANSDYRFSPQYRQRAQVNYTLLSDSISGYSHGIKVNWVDEILTKAIAPNLGERNDSIYGTGPHQVTGGRSWRWFPGYLFGANYGNSGESHYVNLIPSSANDSLSYDFEFRHNAYNDPPMLAHKVWYRSTYPLCPRQMGKQLHIVSNSILSMVMLYEKLPTTVRRILIRGAYCYHHPRSIVPIQRIEINLPT